MEHGHYPPLKLIEAALHAPELILKPAFAINPPQPDILQNFSTHFLKAMHCTKGEIERVFGGSMRVFSSLGVPNNEKKCLCCASTLANPYGIRALHNETYPL